MNRNNNLGIIFFLVLIVSTLIIFTSFVAVVFAHPPLPTEFYGTIKTYNSPAVSGLIVAYSGNTSCGSFNIVNGGFYGVLSCIGQDNESSNTSGGIDGQIITFEYDTFLTSTRGDSTFTSGEFKLVNITHPVIYCGDNFCDSLETCGDCPLDCHSCNYTGNVSQNITSNATSNETTPPGPGTGGTVGGGGGGGGGKGGGGGAGGIGNGGNAGFDQFSPGYTCSESWACNEWSKCSLLGIRNRTCNDRANCGTYNNKPDELEECIYLGDCFDSLINCHDDMCEEGIDCGGPCERKCSFLEQPLFNVSIRLPQLELPTHVCERHINFSDFGLWAFLIIILFTILGRIIYVKYYISQLRKSEKVTNLERAKKIRSANRKTLLFTITLVALTAVALLYSYYFLLCPSDFLKYSWMLILALILIPLIIHTVMKKLEYSESRHIYNNKRLEDVHYKSLVKMIELQNNMLGEEENSIANKLYDLSKKDEFKNFLDNDQNLKDIYNNLIKLYTDYKEKKNPFNIEKSVCDEINALDLDESFKIEVSKHPEMKQIFERLKKLYAHYEEKQKLYDKLDELEQSMQKEKSDKKDEKK